MFLPENDNASIVGYTDPRVFLEPLGAHTAQCTHSSTAALPRTKPSTTPSDGSDLPFHIGQLSIISPAVLMDDCLPRMPFSTSRLGDFAA